MGTTEATNVTIEEEGEGEAGAEVEAGADTQITEPGKKFVCPFLAIPLNASSGRLQSLKGWLALPETCFWWVRPYPDQWLNPVEFPSFQVDWKSKISSQK